MEQNSPLFGMFTVQTIVNETILTFTAEAFVHSSSKQLVSNFFNWNNCENDKLSRDGTTQQAARKNFNYQR
jgi:hypothetical protein